MGPRQLDERFLLAAIVSVVVPPVIVAYCHIVRESEAGGIELDWVGHFSAVVVAFVSVGVVLVLLGVALTVVTWLVLRFRRGSGDSNTNAS
ncbi:MAG: hypothetical protein U0804_12855 [Gemmataceae bacterium]